MHKRIPLAQDLTTRDRTLNKDSRIVNAVFEKDGDALCIVKRPGVTTFTTLGTGTAVGFTSWYQYLFAAINSKVYRIDLPGTNHDLGITTSGQQVSFCRTYLDKHLFFHDGTTFYDTVDGTAITTPARPVASTHWVPGAIWLNNYVYVGDGASNLIYSCHSGDPTTWTSTSNIAFYQTTDTLVALAKHLNYVVAFGDKSMQFYYDAGTGDGSTVSSLATASSYACEIGCFSPKSIASAENTLVWYGWSTTHGKSVFMLNGISPIKISTPSIDRILDAQQASLAQGYMTRFFGHPVYVLQVVLSGIGAATLVYDLSTQTWSQWTQIVPSVGVDETAFDGIYYAKSEYTDIPYFFGGNSGIIYQMGNETYQDNGEPIYTRVFTQLDDDGSTQMKFYRRAEIVGDTSNTTVQLSYTKDDYQTYSTPRTIDMSGPRPAVYQLSQSRRRAWKLEHSDNTPLRLQSLELDFDIGEIDVQPR